MFFQPMSMSARQWFRNVPGLKHQTYAFRACHLRPESRGKVWLRSRGPQDPVQILNNFLSTEGRPAGAARKLPHRCAG